MPSQPSERAAGGATIHPQLIDNNTANSDYVDLSKFHEAMFILSVGATDTTVDFSVRESRDNSGTGEQTLSGKSATQLAGTDDNKQVVINVKAEELTQGAPGSNYRYVRPRVTVGDGTTGAYVSVVGLGLKPRYGPASDDDLADVAQIVS